MKKPHYLILFIFLFGCGKSSPKQLPNVDIKTMTQNFASWWSYYNKNIDLSLDFVALDANGNQIDKKVFLEKLSSENVIAVKLINENTEKETYQLFAIADEAILNTTKQEARLELQYYKREGKKYPDFAYTDLDGNTITSENTKGKIVIVKVWFINCKACVKEFPELNALTQKYANRDNVIFISLAYDEKEKLKHFLSKKALNYQNAQVPIDYITEKLEVQMYPTHFVIDKKGKIVKIFNDAKRLTAYLNHYLQNQ